MNKKYSIALALILSSQVLMADAITDIFKQYQANGVTQHNPQAGKALWNKQFKNKKTGKSQNCATCHGDNLSAAGKHVRTGKVIKPMAPSANKNRFTDVKKIKKWFKRNCKWTIGRECSSQEQANILAYLTKL